MKNKTQKSQSLVTIPAQDPPKNFPSPQWRLINTFQVANPINLGVYGLANFGFETGTAQLGADATEHTVILGHVHDYQDAKEVLGLAEEVRDKAFVAGGGGEG